MRDTFTACARLLAIAWRQHHGRVIAAVTLMVAGAAAAPLTAATLRWLTDDAVAGKVAAATASGVFAAALAIAAITFGHFAHVAYYELAELAVLDLESQLISLAHGSPGLAHLEQPELADRFTVLSREIQRLRIALESLLSITGMVLALGLTGVLLATLNPWLLALLPLAALPLISGRRAERIVASANLACAEDERVALGIFRLASAAASAKELRVLRLRDTMLAQHQIRWDRATGRRWRAEFAATAVRADGQFVFAAGYLGGVLLVVTSAIASRGSAGDVIMVILLAAQVNQQVGGAVSLLQNVQRMGSTLGSIADLLEQQRDDGNGGGNGGGDKVRPPERLAHGIELAGVEFAYPGTATTVLRDINLNLPAGSTVAIVGENGAGKTSLVKLLCGFYQPTRGRILVDGVDLDRMALRAWRERIAAGFQDFAHFELPAKQAVGIGDLPAMACDEAVLSALDRAQAADLLAELPHGLATQLGKSYAEGTELSTGQWQKIALGRAFMRGSPLLVILDEPAAALDAASEHALFERYAEHARRTAERTGAITVLVSHRFSTVRIADLIVVVDDGTVTQAADHVTLVRQHGLYADLYNLQARAYQ